jgi:hypothetical protein
MKTLSAIPAIFLTSGLVALTPVQVNAQTDQEAMAIVRSIIKADRQATVAEALQLSETESKAFWPVYQQYRAQMDRVGNRLVKLLQEYGAAYPNVPEDRAKMMLKEFTGLDKKRVATRAAFLKKFGRILPADKNLRFAQVENRLDLALQLELGSNIPLVPIEGNLGAAGSRSTSFTPGVPGGVTTQTIETTATVEAIDKASRKITLVSSDGFKKTVKAGPQVVNFDQIRIGDRLKFVVAEQLVVQMNKAGESADDASLKVVALAAKGAKPGGVMAETTRVTATVTSIDVKNRKATLRFEDGTSKTFPVRGDIDLNKRKVGEQVVFRVTEMVALSVEKP